VSKLTPKKFYRLCSWYRLQNITSKISNDSSLVSHQTQCWHALALPTILGNASINPFSVNLTKLVLIATIKSFMTRANRSFGESISGVLVKQRTYFPLVSATEMAIWQAILT
jgi:hypothetical protein